MYEAGTLTLTSGIENKMLVLKTKPQLNKKETLSLKQLYCKMFYRQRRNVLSLKEPEKYNTSVLKSQALDLKKKQFVYFLMMWFQSYYLLFSLYAFNSLVFFSDYLLIFS